MNKTITVTLNIDEVEFKAQRNWLYQHSGVPEAEGLIGICDAIHDALEPLDEGRKFTIILHYPPGGGVVPYQTWVEAGDMAEAVCIARHQASEDNDGVFAPGEFGIVAVFDGYIDNLYQD